MLATEEKVKRKAHLKRPPLAGRRTIGQLQIWMTIQIHLKRTGRSRCLILSNCRDWSLIASVVRWHHRMPTWKTWMCAKNWKRLKTPINESLQVLSGETAWVLSDHLAAEPGEQMNDERNTTDAWKDEMTWVAFRWTFCTSWSASGGAGQQGGAGDPSYYLLAICPLPIFLQKPFIRCLCDCAGREDLVEAQRWEMKALCQSVVSRWPQESRNKVGVCSAHILPLCQLVYANLRDYTFTLHIFA